MAVMDITTIGADILRQQAAPVPKITKKIQTLIKDMIETMYAADGVGLAAPQVGVSQRIVVIDVGEGPIVMVNPLIVDHRGLEIDVEGCLSIPGRRGYVKRWVELVVEYMDEKGKMQRQHADALLARAVQHELDHLDGVLFVDIMLEEAPVAEVEETREEQSPMENLERR